MRTSNKKYFKRITIEDMQRARLKLQPEDSLSWNHESNTLVIQYKKPPPILQRERELKQARLTAPEEGGAAGAVPEAAPEECKQQ